MEKFGKLIFFLWFPGIQVQNSNPFFEALKQTVSA